MKCGWYDISANRIFYALIMSGTVNVKCKKIENLILINSYFLYKNAFFILIKFQDSS